MAIYNVAYLIEISTSNEITRVDEQKYLKSIVPKVIKATKEKFKQYNISKYFKPYKYNNSDDEELFLYEKKEVFSIIDVGSAAEFEEEYNFNKPWEEFDKILVFIFDTIKNYIKKNNMSGIVGHDIEKDSGNIWYKSNLDPIADDE